MAAIEKSCGPITYSGRELQGMLFLSKVGCGNKYSDNICNLWNVPKLFSCSRNSLRTHIFLTNRFCEYTQTLCAVILTYHQTLLKNTSHIGFVFASQNVPWIKKILPQIPCFTATSTDHNGKNIIHYAAIKDSVKLYTFGITYFQTHAMIYVKMTHATKQ